MVGEILLLQADNLSNWSPVPSALRLGLAWGKGREEAARLGQTPRMRDQIEAALSGVEAEYRCHVLLAVESGSRAWGFESTNSDWDVRFLYVRSLDAYLSLGPSRDVIEKSLPNDLDMVGWDLSKALRLMHVCNPSLMEWLISPINYREEIAVCTELRELGKTYFNRHRASMHYWNMAKSNFENYLKGDEVSLKKYLYVVRPLLALRWLAERDTWPAIEFDRLVSDFLPEAPVRAAVERVVEVKRSVLESAKQPPDAVLHSWIESELEHRRPAISTQEKMPEWGPLDAFFRRVVAR